MNPIITSAREVEPEFMAVVLARVTRFLTIRSIPSTIRPSRVVRFAREPAGEGRTYRCYVAPVKIGDAAWMVTLRDTVAPECDGDVRAVGLLWAVGLEQAINAWAARRIFNAAAYDSGDVGMQHQGLQGMPDASGLATHVALAVTDDFVHAFEPKYKVSMLATQRLAG